MLQDAFPLNDFWEVWLQAVLIIMWAWPHVIEFRSAKCFGRHDIFLKQCFAYSQHCMLPQWGQAQRKWSHHSQAIHCYNMFMIAIYCLHRQCFTLFSCLRNCRVDCDHISRWDPNTGIKKNHQQTFCDAGKKMEVEGSRGCWLRCIEYIVKSIQKCICIPSQIRDE